VIFSGVTILQGGGVEFSTFPIDFCMRVTTAQR